MAQSTLILEKKARCPCSGFYERKILSSYSKYDLGLRRLLLGEYEEPTGVELRATLGRQIVSNLPTRFRKENNGRFIAVTYTGKVLAVCNTLEALNKEVGEKHIKENYYIERFGHSTITQI